MKCLNKGHIVRHGMQQSVMAERCILTMTIITITITIITIIIIISIIIITIITIIIITSISITIITIILFIIITNLIIIIFDMKVHPHDDPLALHRRPPRDLRRHADALLPDGDRI